MYVRKKSWVNERETEHVPNNSDHFSMSRVWVAVKFNGCKTIYKFDTGQLMQNQTRVTMPPSNVIQKGVDLVAVWLDMASRYKPDVEIHREDFVMALESISLVPCDSPDSPLLHHSFLGGDALQVWDARNVVIVDIRGNSTKVLAVPMHTFNKAGKTKRWEFEWNKSEYIYPDKRIGNRFNVSGEWVGTGSGAKAGIFRWYGSSKSIDTILGTVMAGQEEGVNESAVSVGQGGGGTVQMLHPHTSVSRPSAPPTKISTGGKLPPARPPPPRRPSQKPSPPQAGAQPQPMEVQHDDGNEGGTVVAPSAVAGTTDYASTPGFLEVKGTFQYGGKPLWWHPAFVGMFTDPYVRSGDIKQHIDGKHKLQVFVEGADLLATAIEHTLANADKPVLYGDELQGLKAVHAAYQRLAGFGKAILASDPNGSSLIGGMQSLLDSGLSLVGSSNSRDQACAQILDEIVATVKALRPGEVYMTMAGWDCTPEGSFDDCSVLLLAVSREAQGGTYQVAIVNTGDGSEYHPSVVVPPAAEMRQAVYFTIKGIQEAKIADGTFWFMVIQPLIFPSPDHSAQRLYERILPYLCKKPLSSIYVDNFGAATLPGMGALGWRSKLRGKDPTHAQCLLESVTAALQLVGMKQRQAATAALRVRLSLASMASSDLASSGHVSASEAAVLEAAASEIARVACEEAGAAMPPGEPTPAWGPTPVPLPLMEATLDRVKQLRMLTNAGMAASSNLPLQLQLTPGGKSGSEQDNVLHQFGSLRTDGLNLEALAGDGEQAPVLRPVELTSVELPAGVEQPEQAPPRRIATLNEALCALRRAADCCTLLANQSSIIANTACLRATMIVDLFTRVVPLPLPIGRNESKCFWASQSITRSDQVEILRLLALLSEHLAAAVLSLTSTRSFDACRILAVAAVAAIADAVMRKVASDVPCHLSLEYSGKGRGPISAYGFESSSFAVESETMQLIDPVLMSTRTQVLDYFNSMVQLVAEDHLLFRYHHSNELSTGDARIIDQLCVRLGFPRSNFGYILTGEISEVLEAYPNFGHLRDIIFLFHLLMAPSGDDLPDLRLWKPSDAQLNWTFDDDKGAVKVTAFGMELVPKGKSSGGVISSVMGFFKNTFGGGSKGPRCPPSSANPSALAGMEIGDEDDVLFCRDLPMFDGRINERDSELLISYLTTPYLRIPLILQFFADETRIHALDHPTLQDVVDACLFEPGLWQAEAVKAMPKLIPPPNRSHLATPVGLLFNELQISPLPVLGCVEKILDIALDLNTGRYLPSRGDIILYAIRLAVRVEGYVCFLLENATKSTIRGLWEPTEELQQLLASRSAHLKDVLRNKAFDILEDWRMKAMAQDDLTTACVLHAHLGYLFRYCTFGSYDVKSITTLLSCQIFLTHNFGFQTEATESSANGKKRKRDEDDTNLDDELQIDQMEMFALFQRHRASILKWLDENHSQCDVAMEAIISILTGHGTLRDLATKMSPRGWRTLRLENCAGRFCPDTEIKDIKDTIAEGLDLLQWLRSVTTSNVETEINLQLGTFTLKSCQTEMLDMNLAQHPDFKRVFHIMPHERSKRVQCARVSSTEARLWVRLVGRRHDIQYWQPDSRGLDTLSCTRALRSLRSTEDWVKTILEFVQHRFLNGTNMLVQAEDCSNAAYARAAGIHRESMTVKQVVVYRSPPTVHVYNVVEHGRRFFNKLIFTTNAAFCFGAFDGKSPFLVKQAAHNYVAAVGNPMEVASAGSSLVITRNLNASVGKQTFIPARFLQGLLPACLLEEYMFWQSDDDTLTGYQPPSIRMDSTQTPSIVKVQLLRDGHADTSGRCHATARATVTRYRLTEASRGEADTDVVVDTAVPPAVLLNPLEAPYGSPLAKITELLMRLDNLSHVTVWSSSPSQPCNNSIIGTVELPRVKLSFKMDPGGRLYCEQSSGFFVSDHRCEDTTQLLAGLPHALMLQNMHGELAVLVSAAAKPTRPSTELFPAALVLERNNHSWLAGLPDLRYHIFPVHASRKLLEMPTLGASLYLLVFHFLQRRYAEVCASAVSCTSDTELSPEESQVFEQLALVAEDPHPDAYAARIKLWLAFQASKHAMPCPWSIVSELVAYAELAPHVSAACRLSIEEEDKLLNSIAVPDSAKTPSFRNRTAMLQSLKKVGRAGLEFDVQQPRVARCSGFDRLVDRSCVEGALSLKALALPGYVRPDDAHGASAVKFLNKLLQRGISLTGITSGLNTAGFTLCYELFTGSLGIRILPNDSTFAMASLLMRMMPVSEVQSRGLLMSILRTMEANPAIVSRRDLLPHYHYAMLKYKEELRGGSNGGFLGQLTGAAKEMFNKSKATQDFLQEVLQKLKDADSTGTIHWPSPTHQDYCPPGKVSFGRGSGTGMLLSGLQPAAKINVSCAQRELVPIKHGEIEVSPAQVAALAAMPLSGLDLSKYLQKAPADSSITLRDFDADFPLSSSPYANNKRALKMMERLKVDVGFDTAKRQAAQPPVLKCLLTEADAATVVSTPKAADRAAAVLQQLLSDLQELHSQDSTAGNALLDAALNIANGNPRGGSTNTLASLSLSLAQSAKLSPTLNLREIAAALSSSEGAEDMKSANPFLEEKEAELALNLAAASFMTVVRIGHCIRCIGLTLDLISLLSQAKKSAGTPEATDALIKGIFLKATSLAGALSTRRHHAASTSGGAVSFDPRFLMFEYTCDIILREQQVALVRRFMAAHSSGDSLCHQLIMGAGKTTVVTPLLALLLADGNTCITQVVPSALLEFSRGVMRQRFSSVFTRPIYTLEFDREQEISEDLYQKLEAARDTGAVVVSSPTSIKSLVLKAAELAHILATNNATESYGVVEEKPGFFGRLMGNQAITTTTTLTGEQKAALSMQIGICRRIIDLFNRGVMLLDEVDLVLHPLKSELNWPLGKKEPLHFTSPPAHLSGVSATLSGGMRWKVVWHLFDALFYAAGRKELTSTVYMDSRVAESILEELGEVIAEGVEGHSLQMSPHLCLLQESFYHARMKPLLVRWMMVFLADKGVTAMGREALMDYLTHGGTHASEEARKAAQTHCSDFQFCLLNLASDWLRSLIPHCISKINRVKYGLLSASDLARASAQGVVVPRSRKFCAVPFVGKDVPSPASEFSFPDIVIGLSILAYRYQGLRESDFKWALRCLRESMAHETGKYSERPTAVMYQDWVKRAGGRLRGKKPRRISRLDTGEILVPEEDEVEESEETGPEVPAEFSDIWPLHIVDLKDAAQVSVLYRLMGERPEVVQWYLYTLVFPLTMEFQVHSSIHRPSILWTRL